MRLQLKFKLEVLRFLAALSNSVAGRVLSGSFGSGYKPCHRCRVAPSPLPLSVYPLPLSLPLPPVILIPPLPKKVR